MDSHNPFRHSRSFHSVPSMQTEPHPGRRHWSDTSDDDATSPTSAPAPLQLPTELCEIVIDQCWNDRATLLSCTLVCRSWVARSRFHLYTSISLRSRSDLDAVVLRVSQTPRLASQCDRVRIHCRTDIDDDQSWVSLVPLHLPLMKNLREVILEGFDFTARSGPRF